MLQASPSWVYKGEWNGTMSQNTFVEIRAGQFGYNFGLDSNTDDHPLRIADDARESLGGGRDWELRRRRNQVTGALSYFKDRFAGGSHNVKFGGEYMDEKGETLWNSVLQGQRRPLRQRLAAGPALGDHAGRSATDQQLATAGARWRRPARS